MTYFLRRCDHSDMHFAGASLFLLKEIVHSRFNVNAELRSGQFLRTELVLFPLGPFLLQTIITAEALGPNLVVVENTYLVLFPAAVHANDERLLLQMVIFHLLELILFDRPKNMNIMNIKIVFNLAKTI